MKSYRMLISVAFGLGVMFAVGYAVGLSALGSVEWLFSLARPPFAPSYLVHQILGGGYLALGVGTLAYALYHPPLRKGLALLLPAYALFVLWAVVLFVLRALPAAFALALLSAVLWLFLLDFFLRATRRGAWLLLPLCAYHLLLCALSFCLLLLN